MGWTIEFEQEFDDEYEAMDSKWQDEVTAQLGVLNEFGPTLGRPSVDTLNNSNYPNMKELRFNYDGGVWRIAFAFDPERKGIILVAGDKRGKDQIKFYKQLITTADRRFKNHLEHASKKPPQTKDKHDNPRGKTK